MVKLHGEKIMPSMIYAVPGLSWILCMSRVKAELNLNDLCYFSTDDKFYTYTNQP